ncbi:MAG: homocysteine S-methyltransferase family protein [Hyphomicrobiaceae bacterium]
MPRYRNALPQLSSDIYLTDAGVETDLIFNHGIEIQEFAAHTLLPIPEGRAALSRYFEGFLSLAKQQNTGFVLDTVTWKAHRHWAEKLGVADDELKAANEDNVRFIAELRTRFSGNSKPIVLNAVIGPRGDAYKPEAVIAAESAEQYYAQQLGWLAATEIDMVTALTFNQAGEAAGLAMAARKVGLPAVISFTVETNGALPNGQSLAEAITEVDRATGQYPAYYMVNCAHPDHFGDALLDAPWTRRIRGIRANASRLSHAELDEAPELDAGNPHELAQQYRVLSNRMPWLNVFGGCCGSDLRHVTEIARALEGRNGTV